jgi:prepilin-type N-terminal cleavage/methylation domain-containing protein
MKRAFTLIELLAVIAILGVLLGIVGNVVVGSMQSARARRTESMRALLETAIATAYAQASDGKWPQEIQSLADQGVSGVLAETSAQEVFRKIVRRSTGHDGTVNPLIDPTGLIVARSGIRDGKGVGYTYADARQGDGRGRQPIGPDQMVFGYQGTKTGRFHRFNIIYRAQSDSVRVTTCCHDCAGVEGCRRSAGGNNPCPTCHEHE